MECDCPCPCHCHCGPVSVNLLLYPLMFILYFIQSFTEKFNLKTISLWADRQGKQIDTQIEDIMIRYTKDHTTERIPKWWYHRYVQFTE